MRKEMVERAIQAYDDPQMRLNHIREQLQRILLTTLHEGRAFNHIAFVGGTCLRIVHGLHRYSEDLDFSLTEPLGYDFPRFLHKVKNRLHSAGLEHTIRVKTEKIVHVAQISFPGFRQQVGENPMSDAKLTIKMEVDTRPPSGWETESHIQRSDLGLAALVSYDLPSLFAGKLHALCCRKYTKGRDWYDLVWYLTQPTPVSPNLDLLSNALAQTEGARAWKGIEWRVRLRERVAQLEFIDVKKDIAPFIERKEEIDLFSEEALLGLIQG